MVEACAIAPTKANEDTERQGTNMSHKQSRQSPTGSRGGSRTVAVINPMTHYKPTKVRWLEEGRIAMGKLTLIAGDPGLGKSFMTLELAARVSRGEVGRTEELLSGRAVIMSAEDDAGDTLVPRLTAMHARMNRVHFIEGMRNASTQHESDTNESHAPNQSGNSIDLPALDKDTDLLIDAIEALGDVTLVVIDPISAYMGRADSHNNAEVRSVLAQLARLAQVTGAAVVCVTHLNKDSSGKRAVYRAMGSLAFTAAARTVHLVTKHPKNENDEFADRKRVVSMVKNNLGPIAPARVYVIDEGSLVWLDEELTMDPDALDEDGASFDCRETQGDRATVFLERILDAGTQPAREVLERGEAQGISENALKRAKKQLNAMSYKQGTIWYWSKQGEPDTELMRDSIEPEIETGIEPEIVQEIETDHQDEHVPESLGDFGR
tara:strand:- start:130998 stop:132305 length:1308 start_codon:yes stop_codon:yes gene_type:complete